MIDNNGLNTYRSDDPRFHDPQFQRRVVSFFRPIPFVANLFDVTFDCGHAPLLFANDEPTVGAMMFCPDCYEAQQLPTE